MEQAEHSRSNLGEQWEALGEAWPKLLASDLDHVLFPFTPWVTDSKLQAVPDSLLR